MTSLDFFWICVTVDDLLPACAPRWVLPPGRMYLYPRSFSDTSKPLNLTSGSSSSLSCFGFLWNRRLSMVPLDWNSSCRLFVTSKFPNQCSASTFRNSKGVKSGDAWRCVTFSSVKVFLPLQRQRRCADVLAVIRPLHGSCISTEAIWWRVHRKHVTTLFGVHGIYQEFFCICIIISLVPIPLHSDKVANEKLSDEDDSKFGCKLLEERLCRAVTNLNTGFRNSDTYPQPLSKYT